MNVDSGFIKSPYVEKDFGSLVFKERKFELVLASQFQASALLPFQTIIIVLLGFWLLSAVWHSLIDVSCVVHL